MSVRPATRGFGRLSGWAGEGAVLALALTTPILIYLSIDAASGDPAGPTRAAPPSSATAPPSLATPVPAPVAQLVDPGPTAAPSAPPAPPAATPQPDPAATPFRLVPSPVQASASFTNFSGTCSGYPPVFYDRFTFTTAQGTLTIRQASTNEVSTGPIQPDGSFHAAGPDGRQTYDGRIQGLNATAHYAEARDNCGAAYDVSFRFLV